MPVTPPTPALSNPFRDRLAARERLLGCWSTLGHPICTEIVGLCGFDWILFDGEHSPSDPITFVPQLMALKESPTAAVVRPPSNDPVQIKRLLDIGFFNVLVPFVESAEQARAAVAATRYPPQGIRGVSAGHRSNRYGTVPNYFETINDNLCVLVQIESRAGLDAVDAICQVEGVDGVFVGPSDLAAALGHLNNPNHPDVQAEIARVFACAHGHGKPTGILAPREEDARRYIDMGVGFIAVCNDQSLLRDAAKATLGKFVT